MDTLVYLSVRRKMTRENEKREGTVIIVSTSRWSKQEGKEAPLLSYELPSNFGLSSRLTKSSVGEFYLHSKAARCTHTFGSRHLGRSAINPGTEIGRKVNNTITSFHTFVPVWRVSE